MIFLYFIQEYDKLGSLKRFFKIVKLENEKLLVPMEEGDSDKIQELLAKKTKLMLDKTNCNKIILSKFLKEQKKYLNSLYSYGFDIVDEKWLKEVMICEILENILEKNNWNKKEKRNYFFGK